MTVTLFDLTYKLARNLGTVSEGTATGGTTTTLIDTVERTEDDDYWNSGTLWLLYDAAGAGAAPQGEYGYVSGWDLDTNTITIRTALTAAIGAGDKYALGSPRYPLQLLIQKINEVLTVIPKTDTSITTADSQREYTLPTDVLQLRQVWIQTNSDSNDNQWQQLFDWDVEKTGVGVADKLILGRQWAAGYTLKLIYTAYHQVLRFSSDKLDEWFHEKYVITNATVRCLLWRKAKVGDSDMSVNDLLNYYQALQAQENQEYYRQLPRKSAKTIGPVF